MVFTEVQKKSNRKYYYRTKSVRINEKVKKIRKYLGADLDKKTLKEKEKKADIELGILRALLTDKEINQLEQIKRQHEHSDLKYEHFVTKFTYDSNAIEGNTLTLKETSAVLFDNITPKGKSPREINEAINHKKAFDFMLKHEKDISKDFICKLQKLVTQNTIDYEDQIGVYRKLQVYIRGADFVPPPPKDVDKDMKSLLFWYNKNKKKLHPIILAAYFHSAFESVHPFIDGNGRTGRLIINFSLHISGYPMINIPVSTRLEYYEALEEGRKGKLRPLIKLIMNNLMSTNNTY